MKSLHFDWGLLTLRDLLWPRSCCRVMIKHSYFESLILVYLWRKSPFNVFIPWTTIFNACIADKILSRVAVQSIERKRALLVQACRLSHLSISLSVGLSVCRSVWCPVGGLWNKRLIGSGCRVGWWGGRSRDGCIRWGPRAPRGRDVLDFLPHWFEWRNLVYV